jgi:hypothetical protein
VTGGVRLEVPRRGLPPPGPRTKAGPGSSPNVCTGRAAGHRKRGPAIPWAVARSGRLPDGHLRSSPVEFRITGDQFVTQVARLGAPRDVQGVLIEAIELTLQAMQRLRVEPLDDCRKELSVFSLMMPALKLAERTRDRRHVAPLFIGPALESRSSVVERRDEVALSRVFLAHLYEQRGIPIEAVAREKWQEHMFFFFAMQFIGILPQDSRETPNVRGVHLRSAAYPTSAGLECRDESRDELMFSN